MPLLVPAARNYQSPIIPVPAYWDRDPPEGAKMIACEIDWATMGGPNNSVFFNFQNNLTQPMSQLVALSVDNSQCGADVTFIFPDTSTTVQIPALAPYTVVPVFTNGQQFYVVANGEDVADVTRFQAHNKMPPPVAVTRSVELSTATIASIPAPAGSSVTNLVPAGINGTLEFINVRFAGKTTTAAGGVLSIAQNVGSGSGILTTDFELDGATLQNIDLMSFTGLSARFVNGLEARLAGFSAAGDGRFSINFGYRTP